MGVLCIAVVLPVGFGLYMLKSPDARLSKKSRKNPFRGELGEHIAEAFE